MSGTTVRRFCNSFNHCETLEPRRLLSGSVETGMPPLDEAQVFLHSQSSSTTAVSRQVSVELRAFPGSVTEGSNFYAKVTADAGIPKGLVYFYANGDPIGAGWVVDGEAWMHTKHLPAGTHSVYAIYTGDEYHDRAASNEISHVVKKENQPLAKAVFGRWDWRGNGPTRVYGWYGSDAVVIPTGTLVFHDKRDLAASTWKVTATLDAYGRADFGFIDPPDDLQFLYYTYSGDLNYPAESNLIYIPNPYTPTSPAPTKIRLAAHKSATNIGEAIVLRAFLQRPSGQTLSAAYGGTVEFWHEDMYLGTAAVDPSGIAEFVAVGNEIGSHTVTTEGLHQIRAIYFGDRTHARAEAELNHAVLPAAQLTRTTLTVDRTVAAQNQPMTFVATVKTLFDKPAGDQLGWVRLLDEWGIDIVPPVRVSADGTAIFHLHSLPVDTAEVRAAYQGTVVDNGYTPSKSPSIHIEVTPKTVSTRPTIKAKLSSKTTNRYPTDLIVELSHKGSPVPTGKIALYSEYDGNLFLGYVNIDPDGRATTSFDPGMSKFYQKVRVVYLGDDNYAATEAEFSLIPTYSYLDGGTPEELPPTAAFAFSADVNGDGVKDLIYRDLDSGAVILRFMDNTGQPIRHKTLPSAPLDKWALDAGGDIDGDGVADLLWRHLESSRAYVWRLGANGALLDQGFINSGGTAAGWRIVGTGDFNKDGRADIVWSNDLTGQRAVWLLNGRNVRGVTMFNHAPRDTSWIIQSIEDLNGDGHDDLLWHNTKTGATFVWLLRGTAVVGTDQAR